MTTPFVNAVILAGATVFVHSVFQLSTAPVGSQWFILVALTLLTGSFTIAMSRFRFACPSRKRSSSRLS